MATTIVTALIASEPPSFLRMTMSFTALLALYALLSEGLFSFLALLFNRHTVQRGHRAAILFLGQETGEIVEPGPFTVPLGYDFWEMDARVETVRAGPRQVVCRDSFAIEAQITAAVAEEVPFGSEWLKDPRSFISEQLDQALTATVARMECLRAAEAVAELNDVLLASLRRDLGKYGYRVDSVGIAVLSIPAELNEWRAAFHRLKAEFPGLSPQQVMDFILQCQGRLPLKTMLFEILDLGRQVLGPLVLKSAGGSRAELHETAPPPASTHSPLYPVAAV